MEKEILITEFDLKRLEDLLDVSWGTSCFGQKNLDRLEKKLSNAIVVPAEYVPDTIITMNSVFTVENQKSSDTRRYTLVFPRDADIKGDKISILAPIGIAMLGQKVGSPIQWDAPSGMKQLNLLELNFQPEASGQFDL